MSQTIPAPQTEDAELELLRRLRSDWNYYAPLVLRIQTKRGKTVPLVPNRAQQILHEKISTQLRETGRIRALILKARQEGISTGIGGRIFRGTTLWFNRNGLVVADTDDRSEQLARIYERYRDNCPPELRPAQRTSRRGQEMLFNRRDGQGLDSQLLVTTAGGKFVGRSLTRHYLHLSEFAFWEHQLEALLGLLETVPLDSGEVYIESTANGVGDEFHAMWLAAEAGDNDWLPIFLPWWIHEEYARSLPDEDREALLATLNEWEQLAYLEGIVWEGEHWRLTPEQLAWRRWKIANDLAGDARRFRQEYPSTADEAFLVSGGAYFDEDALLSYSRKTRKPLERGNMLGVGAGLVFSRAERGYLRIFERPQPALHYVIGADTAQGKMVAARDTSLSDPEAERGGRDFSSADVIRLAYTDRDGNRVPPAQVANLHGRMAPEVFGQQLSLLGQWYSCSPEPRAAIREPALEGIEKNHESGQTTLRWLREHGYRRLYIHRRLNKRADKPSEELGWVTDGTTRMPMLDELAEAIRTGTIDIPSADTVRECMTFVRNDAGRPEAQEGTHDDRVISLGIGLQMTRHHTHGAVGEVPEVPREDTPTGV